MHKPNSDSSTNDTEAITEQAITWFVRLRAESVSAAERMEFNNWYQTNDAHRCAYAEITVLWNDSDFNQQLENTRLSAPIRQLKTRCNHWLPILSMVASIALIAIIIRPGLSCLQADYCTDIGEIKTVSLADGSLITLNSNTAIRTNFGKDSRSVQMQYGEAYFEIQHDASRPFLVEAQYSRVKVLGTRFVVRENKQNDQIAVINGVVEVSQGGQNSAILKANDTITVDNKGSNKIPTLTTATSIAWLKGKAVFNNVALSTVIEEIGRYRCGALVFKNNTLKQLKVSGRFDITNTDKTLESLQQTLPIKIYRFLPWLVIIG